EIIVAFKHGNHNMVIEKLKYNGWILRNMSDKKDIVQVLKSFSEDNLSVKKALKKAFYYKVLKKSDGYKLLIININLYFEKVSKKRGYREFKSIFEKGHTSLTKQRNVRASLIESTEQFDDYKRLYNRERKYKYYTSEEFKLNEAFNFLNYQLEHNTISTMHR